MSQSGFISPESNPKIPTSVGTDAGSAIPENNVLQILGDNGILTSAATNKVTVAGVSATAGVDSGSATIGVASFDSQNFTVTDGFVELVTGGIGIEGIVSDDGAPAIGPDGVGLITITGSNGIDTEGQSPSNILTIRGVQATTTTGGVVELATDAEAIAGIDTLRSITAESLKAKLGTQTTNGLAYGSGTTSAIQYMPALSDGQLAIGSTGLAPVGAALASSGGTIDITNGAGSINLEVDATVVNSVATDSGTVTPVANSITIAGGTNMNTIGAGSTVTVRLDSAVSGLTQLDVDNIRINGNTISSTNANGAITIAPDGTGNVNIPTDTLVQNFDAPGDLVDMIIANLDNTAATVSSSELKVQAGQTAIGEARISVAISATRGYAWGIDRATSTDLKVATTANSIPDLQGTLLWNMTSAGERTMIRQPAFLAFLPSTDLSVTGAGGTYTLGGVTALTEVFDQNADFVTTGTFTSPVTGRVQLQSSFFVNNITAAMTQGETRIATSNRTYFADSSNPGVSKTVGNQLQFDTTTFADMDAADTATTNITINNGAGDDAGIFGDSTVRSYFAGCLLV